MKKLNLEKIKAKLEHIPKEFNGLVAQVGFPSGQHYPDNGPSVAYVAAIHEFGAPAAKIPARPFIIPTVKAKKESWVNTIKKSIPRVVHGQATAFDVLDLVGIQAAADIQDGIKKVTSPPLSPITIRRKGSSKPLIDTGLMLASVSNAVNKSGADFVAKGTK